MKVTLYIDGEHNTIEVKDKIKSVLPDAKYMIFHPADNVSKVTEFDRIKNMSVDEFASNYFTLTTNYCEHPETCKKVEWENGRTPCENCLAKWLESEVETE